MTEAIEYIRVKNLGAGGVGSVDLVKSDNQLYALKTISKSSKNFHRQHIDNEIRAGKILHHTNIAGAHRSWEDRHNVYLLMEYVGGWDLFGLIESLGGAISEKTSRGIFRQIVEAVKCLHAQDIAHRDLKLDNVMVDHKLQAKIIDFGLCRISRAKRCEDRVGSPEYCAPEVATSSRYNALQADVWSLGIILFAMLHGSFPFSSADINRIRVGYPIRIPFGASSQLSAAAKDLMLSMLRVNAKRRPTIDEIAEHEWLQE